MTTYFQDSSGEIRLVGTLYAPGATTGNVLTVQSNGSLAPAAGGGSQPGALRRVTVDLTAADLAEGPITLYTPGTDEVVGPVYLYDVVYTNSSTAITIGRDEQISNDKDYPALAGWDSDVSRDGAGFVAALTAADLRQVPLTTGPVVAGFTIDGSVDTLQAPAWDNATVYAQFDVIVAAGHIWYADPGGTSGGSKPDFAGNIGGTVTDGPDIIWTDNGAVDTGSATVSFDVCTPTAP